MKRVNLACIFLTLTVATLAWAHGEDKPGPHGGHIRMPGGFHTELTLDEKQDAHIFLLDIDFKNPTVKDSEIKMKFVAGKKEIPFKCSVMGGDHFYCVPQSKYPLNGELRIVATREKAVGQEVVYKLPLKKLQDAANDSTHHGH